MPALIDAVMKEFEAWWDKNQEQYCKDSLHMSEFHMASVVWKAAYEKYHARAH